jgi:hypothetical protein
LAAAAQQYGQAQDRRADNQTKSGLHDKIMDYLNADTGV